MTTVTSYVCLVSHMSILKEVLDRTELNNYKDLLDSVDLASYLFNYICCSLLWSLQWHWHLVNSSYSQCITGPANSFIFNSIRIFSLAAILCVFGVLPLNYFGQDMHHVWIPSASLETFTIGNMQERSRWWVVKLILPGYSVVNFSCYIWHLIYFLYLLMLSLTMISAN